MNEFLANLYGTEQDVGASTGDDTEKLAQAQILDQMFEAEGININELHPQTVVKVAEAIFGGQTKIAEEDVEAAQKHEGGETKKKEEKEEEKEAEEKLAEADFLGRVMAHSFENERREIEKTALSTEGVKKTIGKAIDWAAKPGKQYDKLRNAASKMRVMNPEAAGGMGAEQVVTLGKKDISKGKALLHVMKRNKGQTAAAAGGAAAVLGGTGAGLHHVLKGKEKDSSALNILAEQRAAEILSQYGTSGEEKLASAVEQRAWEMLAEAGYTVEE